MSAIVVLCTAPDADAAARIARAVVTEGLAACGNVIPGIRSIYRWKDAIEDSSEALLILKSTSERWDALRDRVAALHTYEVPEILRLDVSAGFEPYLAWLGSTSS